MKPGKVFRLLIVLTWLVPILSIALLQVPYSRTPAGLQHSTEVREVFRQLDTSRWPEGMEWVLVGAVVSIILLTVVTTAGLWIFRPWARVAYLPVSLVYVYLLPFGSPYVPSGVGRGAQFIVYLMQGVLLAMAYLPPVGQLFTRARKAPWPEGRNMEGQS